MPKSIVNGMMVLSSARVQIRATSGTPKSRNQRPNNANAKTGAVLSAASINSEDRLTVSPGYSG